MSESAAFLLQTESCMKKVVKQSKHRKKASDNGAEVKKESEIRNGKSIVELSPKPKTQNPKPCSGAKAPSPKARTALTKTLNPKTLKPSTQKTLKPLNCVPISPSWPGPEVL